MNNIRFSVYDGDWIIFQSDWEPETTASCAPNLLAKVRKRFDGDYAYRIERTGDSKEPNRVPMYRFRIKMGETLMYSRLFTETEKDAALAEIKEQYPKAEVQETII